MVFWTLAIVITALACAALYYAAARRSVNATSAPGESATTWHFRLQLKEIEGDLAAGRLQPAEAEAAKGELAREVLRLEGEASARSATVREQRRSVVIAIGATAVVALAVYGSLGRPDLPAQPLAARAAPSQQLDFDRAVARIEEQLQRTPDDVRGWSVIAPVYMQLQRFSDAEHAYRQVVRLSGRTADSLTDLGEAVMMARGGEVEGEPMELFREAARLDPRHLRSRFYVAGALTQTGDFEAAVQEWTELLAMAKGEEAWVAAAREGLAAATAGLNGEVAQPDEAAIRQMVEGLAARLAAEGGSVEEWTRLVRSQLVLGQVEKAQASYDAARRAHPDASVRTELDVLAADNGLIATEGSN